MCSCWGDGDAFDALYVIGEFDEFHKLSLDGLFNDGFTDCVYYFHFSVFFDDGYVIFGL